MPEVLADAERAAQAMAALLALLRGCAPDAVVPAGGLLALLEPLAAGLDGVCGDLRTAGRLGALN